MQPTQPTAADESQPHDPRTYAIIGAALEVFHVLGQGYLERGYQEALANEFRRRGIPFSREVELPMVYKGDVLPCTYRVDFVCFDDVLVELKATSQLASHDSAQVLNYLRLSALDTALLLYFGAPRLEVRRITWFANRLSDDSVVSVASVEAPPTGRADTTF
jgi:GxxExxY protein